MHSAWRILCFSTITVSVLSQKSPHIVHIMVNEKCFLKDKAGVVFHVVKKTHTTYIRPKLSMC